MKQRTARGNRRSAWNSLPSAGRKARGTRRITV